MRVHYKAQDEGAVTNFSNRMDIMAGAGVRLALVCVMGAALSACGPAMEETAESFDMRDLRNTQLTVSGDCLEEVWSREAAPDRRFDRTHDAVEGGSLSCAIGASPKQFDTVLVKLRDAAGRGDRKAVLALVNEPLLFIDAKGARRELATRRDIERQQAVVLTPELLDGLKLVAIDQVTVVPDQGAFFDLGAVWMASRREGAPPVIVTVNLQALEEAQAAGG